MKAVLIERPHEVAWVELETPTVGPGEVLVSSTVRDLVAGSGISFEDRGEHELKGIADAWHLFAVADTATSE